MASKALTPSPSDGAYPARGRGARQGSPRAFRTKGFTLVELAIVLFVITLLLGGMLTPLSQQIAERQNSETRHTLEAARTALAGYALSHRDSLDRPYLPCPDQAGGDGIEDRLADGRCAVVVGGLPWHTLGVAETDAWGNRLGYAISPDFADANHGIVHNPAPASQIELCRDTLCAKPQAVVAVVLSHGRNGLGARNSMGNANLPPVSASERANADGAARFIMRPPAAADRAEGEFDDIVHWISPAWLLGRLCDPAASCAEL
ncbi:MAG: type II secretion system protein [Pseudomonadota bacterium]|nr:type II secretion system protein [Pseudomonadota bacterium]MDP1902931.1 type II secretion system protein [Pseudomonadota bacterium]MDP2353030.1 type II secretion system protein [Pseudomonadota bacterium]